MTHISTYVKIFSCISISLIYFSNGYLIAFILKQAKAKTGLDWLIIIDSALCICSTFGILRSVIYNTEKIGNIHLCSLFIFLYYFINVSNMINTICITLYRYVFVVKYDVLQERAQRKVFEQTLISSIFLIPAVFTGYAFYYKNSYFYYLGIVKKLLKI